MRIGDLLVQQRKLRASDLTRALAEKPADRRLCSFLIAKGLVDFDDAARALGEQKGVACALSKHLAGRDPALAALIPGELGRGSCALPIGKSSKGSVIVCVRDPAPALRRALEQAIRGDILMVITPATRLEHLVGDAYGKGSAEELDIDFDLAIDTVTPPVPRRPLTTPPVPFQGVEPPTSPPFSYGREPGTPLPRPPMADMSALDPESIRLSLTDLDDARVTKDPAQSGHMPQVSRVLSSNKPVAAPPASTPSVLPPATKRPSTLPPPMKPAPAPATAAVAPAPAKATALESMHRGLERATTREAATDLVLEYIATRWSSGLVLAIRDRTAIGYRGHRVVAPESVTVSLGSPSTVQRAVQTRFVSVETPSGVGQSALTHALSGARSPTAAPILVGGQAVAVIAFGDPLEGTAARELAAADLAMLAEALGNAYARLMAR